MPTDMLIPRLHLQDLRKTWPIALMLVLPCLPRLWYYPLATLALALLVLGINLLRSKRPPAFSVSLADLGFGFLLGAVLFSFVFDLVALGWHSLSPHYATWFLLCLSYFSLRWHFSGVNPESLRGVALALLGFLFAWTLYHYLGGTYAELTVRLSYQRGIGNISQIAMYAGLGLLFLVGSRARLDLFSGLGVLLALCLAYMLDSKLLFAIGGLAILSLVMHTLPKLWSWGLLAALAGAFVLLLVISPPASFAGRIASNQVILEQVNWGALDGQGPGNFERFINDVFYAGKAENQVGEIARLAFNDYLQVQVELGYLGLLGLLLITASIFLGQLPFAGMGVALMMASMFPLQYMESGLLWVLVVFLLRDKRSLFEIPARWPLRGLQLLAAGSAFLAFCFAWQYSAWYQADQLFQRGKPRAGLTAYARLHSTFEFQSHFHLQFARMRSQNGDARGAMQEFQHAFSLNQSYEVTTELADALYAQGDYPAALAQYRAARRLRPAKLFPAYRMIYCFLNLQQKSAAQELYREVRLQFAETRHPTTVRMLVELEKLKLLEP